MANYRDEAPQFYKDLTSNGVLAFFEDERATEEDITWIQETLGSEDYKLHKNPISKWNWGKIKTAFATKYFPDIAPVGNDRNATTEERISNLLAR